MSNLFTPAQTIDFDLVGQDGNAFFLVGAWRKQARRDGWSSEDIDKVVGEATSGDYNHLISTLAAHSDSSDEDDEWEDWDDYNEDEGLGW